MEDLGPSQFDGIGVGVKKKRTRASRRPKPDIQPDVGSLDLCPLSTSPPSDDAGKASSGENTYTNPRKEINLNQLVNWTGSGYEGAKICARNKDDGGFTAFYNNDCGRSAFLSKRSSDTIVFKLDRERPAFAVSGDSLFYTKDRFLRFFEFSS